MTEISQTEVSAATGWCAQVQAVFDTTWPTLHLAQDSTWISPWLETQALLKGFPNLMDLGVKVDTGAVAIWFIEYRSVKNPAAIYPDNRHILRSTLNPLTVGDWTLQASVGICRRMRFYVKAIGGRAAVDITPGTARS